MVILVDTSGAVGIVEESFAELVVAFGKWDFAFGLASAAGSVVSNGIDLADSKALASAAA